MRFTIITHVNHKENQGAIYGYGPYVREMNLWISHADEVEVVAPSHPVAPDPIDLAYDGDVIFTKVPAFNLTG
ncbi:MAG: glycosyltransferase family 1 protein, partial [Chitinophagaceae bacterium]